MQKCRKIPYFRNINLTNVPKRRKIKGFIGKFEGMQDISSEIKFKTARSGGKGGQNVNKVETMVEGYWHITGSQLFTDEEKKRITEKLLNRVNADGYLLVKSQEDRTQLGNKQRVIKKMNLLVHNALKINKKRKATKPAAAIKEKRLASKKKAGEIKQSRKKVSVHE